MLSAVFDRIHLTGANGHLGRLVISALVDDFVAEPGRAAFDKESAT